LRLLWLVILFTFSTLNSFTQYYLRGEVRDEHGKPLSNVKITLHSKGNYIFYSGYTGSFGIPSSKVSDTINLSLEGYEPLKLVVDAAHFTSFTLRSLPSSLNVVRHQLASLTKDLMADKSNISLFSNESYSRAIENQFIPAEKYNETGFALNIDRASYSNIRRFINMGTKVPYSAVRIEEMLNYFDFEKNNDSAERKNFEFKTVITNAPWNTESELLYVRVKAPKLNLDSLPPANLVFLIDISGSMDKPNRLPLIKSAFKMLVRNLRQIDTLSIVVYGGTVGVVLPPTSGAEKEKINKLIDDLSAGGDTNGGGAILAAYTLAKKTYKENGNNRVILATDGDFNVGQSSEKDLEDLISQNKDNGIYLTCLGVGMGNYKDSKLEILAKKGNGNFAYIDNHKEAEKIMLTEFTKTLYSVADDAYMTVQFNPTYVKEYRLIGFDNKADALNDASSVLEGGEIGTGHSVVSLFEIIPTEERINDRTKSNDHLATIKLDYKLPNDTIKNTASFTIPLTSIDFIKSDSCVKLAAAVVMFGSLLKDSKYAKDYKWKDVLMIAKSAVRKEDTVQQEFVTLIEQAKDIYDTDKKKKKKKKKAD
jgi:Ca-activated chloride channel family protein